MTYDEIGNELAEWNAEGELVSFQSSHIMKMALIYAAEGYVSYRDRSADLQEEERKGGTRLVGACAGCGWIGRNRNLVGGSSSLTACVPPFS